MPEPNNLKLRESLAAKSRKYAFFTFRTGRRLASAEDAALDKWIAGPARSWQPSLMGCPNTGRSSN